MTVEIPLTLVLTVLLALVLVGCFTALADRSARERAWRQIARERRWDEERRRAPDERPC